jgi:hypothetical protein
MRAWAWCGVASIGVGAVACRGAGSGSRPDDVHVTLDGGAIASISLAPYELTPAFAPSIHDYYVRCLIGANVTTLTVVDDAGAHTQPVSLVEDQALVVNDYWIRCLPHDFPAIGVTTHPAAGAPTPGYYLVNSQRYGAALDTNGTPVWYARSPSNLYEVDSQRANTISYIPNAEFPYSKDLNVRFEVHSLDTLETTTLKAPDAPTDEHELRLLPNGDYLVFTDPIDQGVDLTGLAAYGANEDMADCGIVELDPDGHAVWSWRASDHVDPVRETLQPAVNLVGGALVVDVFHCNAIDVDASGNLLVSFRNTSAVYYIERASGKILWKLGGTSFNKDGAAYVAVVGDPEETFNMQHDARFRPNGDVSLFDDHGADQGRSANVARGVEYALDFGAGTATLVWQYLGRGESSYEGSFRRYDDGESVIGWGYVHGDPRILTEVDAAGDDVLDVTFTAPIQANAVAYRAVKVPPSRLDIDVLRASTAR